MEHIQGHYSDLQLLTAHMHLNLRYLSSFNIGNPNLKQLMLRPVRRNRKLMKYRTHWYGLVLCMDGNRIPYTVSRIRINSKEFWQWHVTTSINRFLDFCHIGISNRTHYFRNRNCICSCLQMKGWGNASSVGSVTPITHLDHMSKVHRPSNTKNLRCQIKITGETIDYQRDQTREDIQYRIGKDWW